MAADLAYQQLIASAENLGFFHLFLPFLLVFSLVFAILESSKILYRKGKEEESKRLNLLVSLSFALYVVWNRQIIEALLQAIPLTGLAILGIFGFLVMLALIVGKDISESSIGKGLLTLFAIVVILYSFGSPFFPKGEGVGGVSTGFALAPEDIAILLFIGMFLLIMGALLAGGKEKSEKQGS